jgi:hypothetical protein
MESQTFGLKFSTSNSAFDGQTDAEIARILRQIADTFERGGLAEGIIRDLNGNTIGRYEHRHQ